MRSYEITLIIPMLVIICCAGSAVATPLKEWNRTYKDAGINDIVQTSDEGYTLAGYKNSYSGGLDSAYLIKTDKDGNMQWNKIIGGSKNDGANSVQQTRDGDYILAGSTSSYGAGNSDAWLIKVSGEAVESIKPLTPGMIEKAAGFEIVLPITTLLAVYILVRMRK